MSGVNLHAPTAPPVVKPFPDKVVVMIEASCAARCPSCPFSSWNSPIRESLARDGHTSLDLRVASKIVQEIGQNKSWVHFTGAGEPFQWPHGLVDLIWEARTEGARTWVNTHGNLVGPDVAMQLLQAGHDVTEFSVDAADEKTYGIVRRGLSWNLLLANIDTMLELRARYYAKGPSRVIVSVILQDLLKAKLAEVEKFWKDRGVDHVSFRKFLTWGAQSDIDSRHAIMPDAYLRPEDGDPCPYPFERMGVDSTGHIVICNADITGQTDFGDLNDEGVTIAGAWNSEAMKKVRELHAAGRGREASKACAGCTDWSFRSWTHNYAKIDRLTKIGTP